MNRHLSLLAAVLLPVTVWAQGSRFIHVPLTVQSIAASAAITNDVGPYSGRIHGFAVSDSSTGIIVSVSTVGTNGIYNGRTLLSVTETADSIYTPRLNPQNTAGATLFTNEFVNHAVCEEYIRTVVTNLATNANTARIYMILE